MFVRTFFHVSASTIYSKSYEPFFLFILHISSEHEICIQVAERCFYNLLISEAYIVAATPNARKTALASRFISGYSQASAVGFKPARFYDTVFKRTVQPAD